MTTSRPLNILTREATLPFDEGANDAVDDDDGDDDDDDDGDDIIDNVNNVRAV